MLPPNVLGGMNLTRKIVVELDLPNINQSSLENIEMVDKINGISILNKNKYHTAVDSDCPLLWRSAS